MAFILSCKRHRCTLEGYKCFTCDSRFSDLHTTLDGWLNCANKCKTPDLRAWCPQCGMWIRFPMHVSVEEPAQTVNAEPDQGEVPSEVVTAPSQSASVEPQFKSVAPPVEDDSGCLLELIGRALLVLVLGLALLLALYWLVRFVRWAWYN